MIRSRLIVGSLSFVLALMVFSAGETRAGTFTIPQNQLLNHGEFSSGYGNGSFTRSDVGGVSVDFAFTGLDADKLLVKDDYEVENFYGQNGGTHNADFLNFSGYSLLVKNLDDASMDVHLFINTGFTGASGNPPSDPSNDTFWAGPWVSVPPGGSAVLMLDFAAAEAWNIVDNKIPHTGGGQSWPDGGIYAINTQDLAELTSIGFEVADFSGSNPDGVLRFTPRSVAVLAPGTPQPQSIGCGDLSSVAFAYTPDSETTPLKGYSARIIAGASVDFDESDITIHTLPGGSTVHTEILENGDNDFTIDYAILGATTGIVTAEDLFSIELEGISDGFATVYLDTVIFRDLDNDDIAVYFGDSVDITVDCAAPDPPDISAEPPFTAGTSNTIYWSDESGSGAVDYYAECGTTSDFSVLHGNSGWTSSLNHLFTGLDDGEDYFYRVMSRDAEENESDWSASESSTQDATPPASNVDALPAYQTAATFDVAYTASDGGSGVAGVVLFYNYEGGSYSSYGSYGSSPISFTAGADGEYGFYTVAVDVVGNNEGAPGSPPDASTILDTQAPTGSFVINNDEIYCTEVDVILHSSVSGAAQMRFSNSGGWGGPEEDWLAYGASHAWALDGGDGLKTVSGEFRDEAGNKLGPLSDDITLDGTGPGAASAFVAEPAHEQVALSWTDPADGDLAELEIWRAIWQGGGVGGSAYPYYDDDPSSYLPPRPADRAAAEASADWTLAGSVAPGLEALLDDLVPRGVYFYEIFGKDAAGNYGPRSDNQALATNYWLADVSDGVYGNYDGLVTLADVTVLGSSYGLGYGDGGYMDEMDVGPSDDSSGTGIPDTDLEVDFEDLMILSLNYGVVAPRPIVPEGTVHVHLEWRRTAGDRYLLVLVEPCQSLKGMRIWSETADGLPVTVEMGPLLGEQVGPVFLENIESSGLDTGFALLGEGLTIQGSGELLSVALSEAAELDPPSLYARSGLNRALEIQMEATGVDELPRRFGLTRNFPNPFNPKTEFRLELPEAELVRAEIFSADGRRVALIHEGRMPAGFHRIVWTGRDDAGEGLSSGIYYLRLEAGPHLEMRKLVLLK